MAVENRTMQRERSCCQKFPSALRAQLIAHDTRELVHLYRAHMIVLKSSDKLLKRDDGEQRHATICIICVVRQCRWRISMWNQSRRTWDCSPVISNSRTVAKER